MDPQCPADRATPGRTPKGRRTKTDLKAKRARTTMMITRAIVLPLFEFVMMTS
jgi:hypothetical protein